MATRSTPKKKNPTKARSISKKINRKKSRLLEKSHPVAQSGQSGGALHSAPDEQWPRRVRSTLFRPERMVYVKKLDRPKGCVFCLAHEIGESVESLLLYSGRDAMVIMNKYPYNSGHLLVLPVRHCGDYTSLRASEIKNMHLLVQECVKILTKIYEPAGFNIGLNLGKSAGAGIPEHIHVHIVPRWKGDMNFFPILADTKVVIETLGQTFARLKPCFDSLR